MKRLVLGLAACAFLSLIGLQASHHHDESHGQARSCDICVLGGQTARLAPAPAPVLVTTETCQLIFIPARLSIASSPRVSSSARAPPAA